MWTLKNITARNIASFHQLEYELTQGVTTLIFGQNSDNESQVSNGSGKSALIEAIAIALTGEPLRKITASEIINDSADEAEVIATLWNRFTGETFVISRRLHRKNAQIVSCAMFDASSNPTRTDEVVQSSVADYNKYILDTLGVTKEEVYSIFVLSKHRYKCFLGASDKDKKETINKFFDAQIVDGAVDGVSQALEAAKWSEDGARCECNNLSGMLRGAEESLELIRKTDDEESKKERKDKIAALIAEKQKSIEGIDKETAYANADMKDIELALGDLDDLERWTKDSQWEEGCQQIAAIVAEFSDITLGPQIDKLRQVKEKMSNAKETEARLAGELQIAADNVEDAKDTLRLRTKQEEECQTRENERIACLAKDSEQAKSERVKLQSELEGIYDSLGGVSAEITKLKAAIEAGVKCPKCSHEFSIDGGISLEEAQRSLGEAEAKRMALDKKKSDCEAEMKRCEEVCRANNAECKVIEDERAERGKDIRRIKDSVDIYELELKKATERLEIFKREVATYQDSYYRAKRNVLDAAVGILENEMAEIKRSVKRLEDSRADLLSQIEGHRRAMEAIDDDSAVAETIETLTEKIEGYKESLKVAQSAFNKASAETNRLEVQKKLFAEFKTYLANSKIDAIAASTNAFLEKIGSDIRVKFEGFTTLKSGKIRDKISVSLLRNGEDCGSFDKFSEGEKARVNLANILALHELTNSSCDEGKGLDLLVLDEILEATDETGLAAIFEALNGLRQTSLIVSHGMVAEGYPHRLVVSKHNNISYINE